MSYGVIFLIGTILGAWGYSAWHNRAKARKMREYMKTKEAARLYCRLRF